LRPVLVAHAIALARRLETPNVVQKWFFEEPWRLSVILPIPRDPEYFPILCSTKLVRDAAKDIQELGRGRKPEPK
jgi:hypothetical protein